MIALFVYNVASNAASFARASINPLVAMDMTLLRWSRPTPMVLINIKVGSMLTVTLTAH